jgi:hypothetical protein
VDAARHGGAQRTIECAAEQGDAAPLRHPFARQPQRDHLGPTERKIMKNDDDVLRSRHAAGLPDATPAPASDALPSTRRRARRFSARADAGSAAPRRLKLKKRKIAGNDTNGIKA